MQHASVMSGRNLLWKEVSVCRPGQEWVQSHRDNQLTYAEICFAKIILTLKVTRMSQSRFVKSFNTKMYVMSFLKNAMLNVCSDLLTNTLLII